METRSSSVTNGQIETPSPRTTSVPRLTSLLTPMAGRWGTKNFSTTSAMAKTGLVTTIWAHRSPAMGRGTSRAAAFVDVAFGDAASPATKERSPGPASFSAPTPVMTRSGRPISVPLVRAAICSRGTKNADISASWLRRKFLSAQRAVAVQTFAGLQVEAVVMVQAGNSRSFDERLLQRGTGVRAVFSDTVPAGRGFHDDRLGVCLSLLVDLNCSQSIGIGKLEP